MAHRIAIRHYSRLPGVDQTECVYCGEPAEHLEHVLPVRYSNWRATLTPDERAQLVTVPACAECNQVASAKAFRSIIEKRDYIRVRLTKRYAKILASPVWTDEELAELGPGLRGHVEGTQARRRLTLWRLAHDGIPATLAAVVPIFDEPMECGVCAELAECSTIEIEGVLTLACPSCARDAVCSSVERSYARSS